jgi:hypothetical protein
MGEDWELTYEPAAAEDVAALLAFLAIDATEGLRLDLGDDG